jgi:ribosomal protein S18 acetylase RimI-like enzyme
MIVIIIRLLLLSSVVINYCHALAVIAPSWEGGSSGVTTRTRVGTADIIEINSNQQLAELNLRIRSTVESDIKEIANILTHALIEEEQDKTVPQKNHRRVSPFNFKFKSTVSGVTSLLQSRIDSIKIGKKFLTEGSTSSLESPPLTEADQLRMLWSNDKFRSNIENAASLSNEPHIWKDHNFMCAPQSFDWLFHKMITAENTLTGEIVGFCEIAMLSKPSLDDDDCTTTTTMDHGLTIQDVEDECSIRDVDAVPTIINFITSPEYRRRGVGSSIVNSALKYVHTTWPGAETTMALYVEEDNTNAINMYKRLGFKTQRKVESTQQLYMTQ